jgi:hypothetical protein
VIQLDGTIKRVLRAEVLGLAGELSERATRNKMAVLLRPINEGKYRPEATITFFTNRSISTAKSWASRRAAVAAPA